MKKITAVIVPVLALSLAGCVATTAGLTGLQLHRAAQEHGVYEQAGNAINYTHERANTYVDALLNKMNRENNY